jgi:hypothetical protein
MPSPTTGSVHPTASPSPQEDPPGASPDNPLGEQGTSWPTTTTSPLSLHRCNHVAARPRRPTLPRLVRADVTALREVPRPDPTPTTAAQSQWCKSPPPLHTPTLDIGTGQRADESGRHGGVDPSFPPYSPRTSALPFRFARLHCSQAWAEDRGDRIFHPTLDTPAGYMKGPPPCVSAGQGPKTHMVAGEGFEPSKLSRWIYSPKAASL